jgi:hypothetical protein
MDLGRVLTVEGVKDDDIDGGRYSLGSASSEASTEEETERGRRLDACDRRIWEFKGGRRMDSVLSG